MPNILPEIVQNIAKNIAENLARKTGKRTRTGCILLAVASMPFMACSSMPLLPGDSNLATVGYVQQTQDQKLKEELPGRLDAALVDDRKQISQLQQRVIAQETELEEAQRQLASTSQALDKLSQDMRAQAETFQVLAEGLQDTTVRLDAALSALPTDTLRLFSNALAEYLATREAAPAGGTPPPKEAAKTAEVAPVLRPGGGSEGG